MLRLRCFGRVAVVDSDGRERSLRSRKHAALLLYLASHPRTTHTRDDLADLLWNGVGARERHSLSQALYDIRSNVDDVVDVTTTSVRLPVGRIEFEGADFERAVESGDHDLALDLYRGDFAPALADLGVDSFDRWIDAERERHRVLASIALRNAQRHAEERGDWDRMCLASLRLVRLNEFDEEAHCALMRGLWMKGDPASALRHYRSLRPGLTVNWQSVADLVERLERSGAVREVLTIPHRPIELIGREREFARLFDAYRTCGPKGAIVVVTGERGIGKTALLREFARLIEARGGSVAWEVDSLGVDSSVVRDGPIPVTVMQWGSRVEAIAPVPRRFIAIHDRSVPESISRGAVRIHLNPLEDPVIEEVVSRKCSDSSPAFRRHVALLAGGNPGFAEGVVNSGWSELGGDSLKGSTTEELAKRAVECSPALRRLGNEWLADLSKAERRVAGLVALLTGAGRQFISRVSPEPETRNAWQNLEARDWIVTERRGPRLRYPIVAALLDRETGTSEVKAFHERAARILQCGSPAERLAAAFEWQAAGESEAARGIAEAIIQHALRCGDTVLATRAAPVAAANAHAVEDRVRIALLSGEAELQRGRAARTERIARTVLDVSESATERLAAQTLLIRALVQCGGWTELRAWTEDTGVLATTVADSPLRCEAELQVAHGALVLASSAGHPDMPDHPEEIAGKLEDRLQASLEFDAGIGGSWHEAFRTLFMYRTVTTSRDSAQTLLRKFAPSMARIGGGLAELATLSQLIVEARAGRTHNAVALGERLLEKENEEDRTQAAILNNLGVLWTELGEFDRARGILTNLRRLDETLAPPTPERLTTLLNLAQTEWCAGNAAEARSHASVVLHDAPSIHDLGMEAEATALLGLMAIEEEDVSGALALSDRLVEAMPQNEATQDQYLIAWFRAAIQHCLGRNPKEELWYAADALRDIDLLSAQKLRVVACQFGALGNLEKEVARSTVRDLRAAGSGWFIRKVGVEVASLG